MDKFGSFFKALKMFISEMLVDESKELKTIELGEFTALIKNIPEMMVDLVIISNKDDRKFVEKLIPGLINTLLNHRDLFNQMEYDAEQLQSFDNDLIEAIFSEKKVVNGLSIEKHDESIYAQRGELSIKLKEKLNKERDSLYNEYTKTDNYIMKFKICDRLLEISKELRDQEQFIEYQNHCKIIQHEIKDRKIKLEYYLKKIKNALSGALRGINKEDLHEGNYKDVYLNLYSFSKKLDNFATPELCEKYYGFARNLSNKHTITNDEISQIISDLKNMSEDVEDLFIKD